jgi:hypothetical protein
MILKNSQMSRRVVITGLGVVAPNGVGLDALPTQLKWDFWDTERSRFRAIAFFVSNLRNLKFQELSLQYFTELELRNFNSSGILYGVIAGMDVKDADLPIANGEEPDWDSGTILCRNVWY